jgi:hypothetical protein
MQILSPFYIYTYIHFQDSAGLTLRREARGEGKRLADLTDYTCRDAVPTGAEGGGAAACEPRTRRRPIVCIAIASALGVDA